MSLSDRLSAAFDIRADERRLVARVLSYGFALGLGRTFCATALSGLFLSIFGAQAMPFVFIGTALVVPITGVAFLRLRKRLSLSGQIAGTLVVIAVALLGLRGVLAISAAPWLALAAMIGYTIVYVLVTLAFWGVSGAIFNVRQAKRLFGLLGGGSELADIVGGILTILLAPLIGSLNLLFLATGAFLVALAIQRTIMARAPQPAEEPGAAQPAQAATPAALLQSQYVRLLFGLIAVSQIGYFFVENIFYDLAMAHFAGPEQFASLVGGTVAATSILTLLLQFGVAGRLAGRFGMRVTQVILPIALLVGAAAVAVSGTLMRGSLIVFGVMLLTRVGERALRFSIEESSIQIAYQPLPAAQRSLAQTLVAGGVKPLAAGVAGAVILIAMRLLGLTGVELAYGLVLICAAWVFLAYRLARAYGGALIQALSQHRLSGASLDLSDSTSMEIVRRSLASPHPGEVLYALALIEETDSPLVAGAIEQLLTHPHPQVRRGALERLECAESLPQPHNIARIAERDPDPALRAQALRVLATHRSPLLGDLIPAAQLDHDPQVRRAATFAHAIASAPTAIAAQLQAHATSATPAERIWAADLIGDLGDQAWVPLLGGLLRDPDAAVARAALQAVAQVQSPQLWPDVIDRLGAPELRGQATSAMIAGGAEALHALEASFSHPSTPHELRIQIARVAGRMGSAAAQLLLPALDSAEERLRHQVIAALAQCGYRANPAQAALLQAQIRSEAAHAAWLLAAQRDLGEEPSLALVVAALQAAVGRSRTRVLSLLAMIADPDSVRVARESLTHASGERRAYAIETIDLLLTRDLKPIVLPLIESDDPAATHAALARSFPHPADPAEHWLMTLSDPAMVAAHPWLRQCAAAAAQQLGLLPADQTVLDLIARVDLLKRAPIFAAVPDEELASIAAALQPVSLPGDALIVAKGDPGDAVYLIAHGRVRVHDGALTLNTLAAGELFGEAAVLDNSPRLASVTAIEECMLLRLDRAALDQLIGSHVVVAHGIIRVLIRYLRSNVHELKRLDAQLRAQTT
jgi:ATP:ADP antiporter, AAA family